MLGNPKLSGDLSDLPQDLTEEVESEPVSEEVEPEQPKTAGDALFAFPGAPDRGMVEEWKQKHGEVLVSAFSELELFVFRPLTRREWINLQVMVQRSQEPLTTYDVEEKICDTCVLWASQPGLEALERKAGCMSTLHEQIMQSSNFVDPRFASSYVTKL